MRLRFARRATAFGCRFLLQGRRDGNEEFGRRPEPAFRDAGEDARDDGLDRAGGGNVELPAAGSELEPGPPPVLRVPRPADETASLEAMENPGQRARVHPQDPGEGASRDPGPPAKDPERDSLRTREPEGRVHPFRQGLQAVVKRPDQAHEVEHFPEFLRGLSRRVHAFIMHGN